MCALSSAAVCFWSHLHGLLSTKATYVRSHAAFLKQYMCVGGIGQLTGTVCDPETSRLQTAWLFPQRKFKGLAYCQHRTMSALLGHPKVLQRENVWLRQYWVLAKGIWLDLCNSVLTVPLTPSSGRWVCRYYTVTIKAMRQQHMTVGWSVPYGAIIAEA